MRKLLLKGTAIVACMLCVAAQGQVGENDKLLNANLATPEELAGLPQVSPALAEAIVAGRPYLTAADLDAVLAATLDADQRQAVYQRLFRPIDLNSAPGDEIMLIPGMSSRMVHEFEEYRPYTSLEQFRREIGKYVDEDEVARLESYVTLD